MIIWKMFLAGLAGLCVGWMGPIFISPYSEEIGVSFFGFSVLIVSHCAFKILIKERRPSEERRS